VAELERCVKVLGLAGLKLHLPDSGVNLLDPGHVAALRRVFEAANRLRVPVVVHLGGAGPRPGDRARAFLPLIGSAASNITIQVAHLGGTGPGLDDPEALEVFSEAAQAGQLPPGLVLDVSSVVTSGTPEAELPRIAAALRSLGVERLVFGSDRSGDRKETPGAAWRAFRRLPLSEAEFQEVARAGFHHAP
jgi:predicted TIM-barrel fold metal-dependent hydrolase